MRRSEKSFIYYVYIAFLSQKLCLKVLEKMQKTRNESDHPGLRKRPKIGIKWPILNLVNFIWFWDDFSPRGKTKALYIVFFML